MASIGQQRQEAIDKWEEDPEGNLQAKEQSDVPYYIRNPEQDPAQGWQQPAEYESTSPAQKPETHRPMGAVVTDDYQTNRVGIKGPEGLEFYSVGDYVPGLGNIEDIDENGRATILPDDPNEPAYKLGHSDSTSQEKAESEMRKQMEHIREQMDQHQWVMMSRPSWLEAYREAEGREVSEEAEYEEIWGSGLGEEINPSLRRADLDPTGPIPEGMGRFEAREPGELMDWSRRMGAMPSFEHLEVEDES